MALRPRFRLYLITDRRVAESRGRGLVESVTRACGAVPRGSLAVQLREKDLEGRALFDLAAALREVTSRAGALLFVNDRADVARAVLADGVHLPASGLRIADARRAFPDGLVAVSTHSPEEVARAAEEGADLALLGPLYETASKRAYGAPLGEAALRAGVGLLKIATSSRTLPLFALGGVDAARAPALRAAGAAGIACISAVLAADDPGAAASALLAAFDG